MIVFVVVVVFINYFQHKGKIILKHTRKITFKRRRNMLVEWISDWYLPECKKKQAKQTILKIEMEKVVFK